MRRLPALLALALLAVSFIAGSMSLLAAGGSAAGISLALVTCPKR